ncbi:class I SAM-dependent methyltransferase [Pseudomonas japonica]|uniref:Methyltransferase domain-containing protein n=1 Tax=Pseudomonas japonica TaxID=256466 RepID=A0A239LB63_9PSED|nr:class I SAM-dependent methyltransferase [Pseudomonas japonica]SNT26889.1 Methyltransferase domain-containing protein [Pseudomonas japonica]
MTSSTFKDHFSSGSAGYAAYRPSYPLELIDELTSISPGTGRVLDCGCGTGQLSVLLAERFDEVIATDASAAQIAAAEPREGVVYRTALAEDSGLSADSVDLITVAQAAHWLDLEAFYDEARRIARPQAAIALITYGVLHLEGELDRPLQQFYYQTIAPYWPPERRHVETGYRDLPFPFTEIEVPPQVIEMRWTLAQLIGYLNTWSAVKAAEKALGHSPLDSLAQQLAEAWGDPATRRLVTWPLTLRAGRIRG